MKKFGFVLAVVFLATASVGVSAQSRLEKDFKRQRSTMRVLIGGTDEPSCSGTMLVIWSAGKEKRKMEWTIWTSQRIITREFYFSRGKPELVIETSDGLRDDRGKWLKTPRREYRRRFLFVL